MFELKTSNEFQVQNKQITVVIHSNTPTLIHDIPAMIIYIIPVSAYERSTSEWLGSKNLTP